jgi:hypothetical protein
MNPAGHWFGDHRHAVAPPATYASLQQKVGLKPYHQFAWACSMAPDAGDDLFGQRHAVRSGIPLSAAGILLCSVRIGFAYLT